MTVASIAAPNTIEPIELLKSMIALVMIERRSIRGLARPIRDSKLPAAA
jgi:hypothetical protein